MTPGILEFWRNKNLAWEVSELKRRKPLGNMNKSAWNKILKFRASQMGYLTSIFITMVSHPKKTSPPIPVCLFFACQGLILPKSGMQLGSCRGCHFGNGQGWQGCSEISGHLHQILVPIQWWSRTKEISTLNTWQEKNTKRCVLRGWVRVGCSVDFNHFLKITRWII